MAGAGSAGAKYDQTHKGTALMRSDDECLRRYHELRAAEPQYFDHPEDCPTQILVTPGEIEQAQHDVLLQRQAMGWPVDDLRVGILAEDPYIGYFVRDAVRFFDGKLGLYNRVVASGGIVVLPVLPDGNIALIRIFRHAARRWFLEAPQGFFLEGSDPAEEARRELNEEIGAEVEELVPIGVVFTSTAMTSENLKMFVGRISATGAPQRSEGIESIHTIAAADIDRLVDDGTICDGPTMSLILRARICGLL